MANTIAQLPSAQRLRALLNYHPLTGVLTWRASGREAGWVASIDKARYYRHMVRVDARAFISARLIWCWVTGGWPTDEIDHINGVSTDNRATNLREVTGAENHRNMKQYKNNTSGVVGAFLHRNGRWRAYISINRVRKHLGYFDTKEEAIVARKEAEMRYAFHPNHGRTS